MLTFFSKIRWRLAQDNQFLKYSRYAIGEIVLVVIGILIALQINNWNEDRKSEKRIKTVLSEIQRDILHNLQQIDKAISDQSFQHSLLVKILTDTLEPEHFIEDSRLVWAINWYSSPIIRTTGFDKLKKLEEEISDEYVELTDSIQSLYLVYEANKIISEEYSEITNENERWMTDKWKWYAKYFIEVSEGRNEETVSFLSQNPFYRNRVHLTSYTLEQQDWFYPRYLSYHIYEMIGQFTGVNELPSQYLNLIEANLEEYSGMYKFIDTIQVVDNSMREIRIINDALTYLRDDYIFDHIIKDSFVNEYDNSLFFQRDSSGTIVGATRYVEGTFLELEKID